MLLALRLSSYGRFPDENRRVRRGMVLVGLWVLGVAVAVTLAFAAVGAGRTRRRAARQSRGSSQAAIDERALRDIERPHGDDPAEAVREPSTSTTRSTTPTDDGHVVRPSRPPSPSGTTSTAPPPTTPTTASPPPTVAPQNTATPSQGGTIFTRCSGPSTIVYVAAVPKQRIRAHRRRREPDRHQPDVRNGRTSRRIDADCAGGTVHARGRRGERRLSRSRRLQPSRVASRVNVSGSRGLPGGVVHRSSRLAPATANQRHTVQSCSTSRVDPQPVPDHRGDDLADRVVPLVLRVVHERARSASV